MASVRASLIRDYANRAVEDVEEYRAMLKRNPGPGTTTPAVSARYDKASLDSLIDIIKTCFRVTDVPLLVGGHVVSSMNISLNTALAVGNDAVCVAAKIHGWCEIHPWIEETDRSWLADVIESALDAGIYREEICYSGTNGDASEKRQVSQGWDEVIDLLRDTTRNPGEVVLSCSVCDSFPNAEVSTVMPPWPDGVEEDWDALSCEQQEERRRAREAWSKLDDDQRWQTAMDGIRASQPWANIAPETLRDTFGVPVSLFDVFHSDRDARVRDAFAVDVETEDGQPLADSVICGESIDHDEEITYDGPDGVQWRCRRCDAEGFEESSPTGDHD